jgi:hypothetical protein
MMSCRTSGGSYSVYTIAFMSLLQNYFDSAIFRFVYDNKSLSSLPKQLAAIYCLTSDASAWPGLTRMTKINGFPIKQDTFLPPR